MGLLHSTSSHFSYLTTFYPHIVYNNSNSTVCMCVCDYVCFIFPLFFISQRSSGSPKNALKSRVLYLEMLSLFVSSSPRYNCRICELRRLRVTEQTKVHFTLVPSGSGEWLQCNVLNVKPVSHSMFVLNLMWTYFSMLLSSRHLKCMHLWKCIL